MIFTNPAALDEDIAIESGNANQPQESKVQPSEEPEEVVVHTQPPETQKSEPVTKAQDEVPLLSTIMDYEDGKKGDESKCTYNSPFYSCVLSDLALDWKRGWGWHCFDTNLTAFHM